MRLTIEKILVLKQISLFASMRENALSDMLLLGEEHHYAKGETIVAEGEEVDSLYVILQGKVNVEKNDKVINSIVSKEYFGLLFSFDAAKTRFSFKAVEDTIIFKIDGDGLYDLISEHKDFAHNLIMTMCRRIKEKDRWEF